MVSDERAEKALTYLVETDEPCAMAQSRWEGLHQLRHQAEGYAVKEKEKTKKDGTFKAYVEKVEEAKYEYLRMKNKRNTEALFIETWRTESANRRKCNI